MHPYFLNQPISRNGLTVKLVAYVMYHNFLLLEYPLLLLADGNMCEERDRDSAYWTYWRLAHATEWYDYYDLSNRNAKHDSNI